MRNLWLKIGLGAGAVFATGMMLVTIGRQAKTAAAQALSEVLESNATVSSVSSAPADLGFRLDGDRIGSIQRLVVRRDQHNELPSIQMNVVLDSDAAGSALSDCILVPERWRDFDLESGFVCAEGLTGDLIELGQASFTPGDFSRPVMIAPEAASELRQGDPFQLTADLGEAVKIKASGKAGDLVRVIADHRGASVKINDAMGRAIVRLLADSTGASLHIRDSQGRDIVQIEAHQ